MMMMMTRMMVMKKKATQNREQNIAVLLGVKNFSALVTRIWRRKMNYFRNSRTL